MAVNVPARPADAGAELKRGALFNTIAILASNFRGVFTFLIARLLGAAALGTFSVAWATTDLFSKIGVFGLDNTITTFIARSEAVGTHARSRMLFRLAVALGVMQSAVIAACVVVAIELFGPQLGLNSQMVSTLALLICAMPGIALYRISTSVSRGMKVMAHDIYSRGLAEPIATTSAFLLALTLGFAMRAPAAAAIVGTAMSGVVAFCFASTLFRGVSSGRKRVSVRQETREMLSYAAPISAYQALNSLISRLDVIMLGCFVGRAPGVTLTVVGVYGAAVEVANGARKVNQAFNPIFIPVVAGMTATGDHHRAAATYARLAQWMLWILLPLISVMALAGSTILMIYGTEFRQGGTWLAIIAVACATHTFVSLGETVIMVQRPGLNLRHSLIASVVALGAMLLLIPRYGAIGAAFGILVPYSVLAILRYRAMRFVFQWRISLSNLAPPMIAAIAALVPALILRVALKDVTGQIASAAVFLAIFGLVWNFRARLRAITVDSP